MLPLRTIIYRSKAIGLSGKTEEYRIASCIDLGSSVNCPVEIEEYQNELTRKIVDLASCALAQSLRNYEDPSTVHLDLGALASCDAPLTVEKVLDSGTPADPNKLKKHRPAIIYRPLEEELELLNHALLGYTSYVIWPSKEILPPKDYDDAWFSFPVVMYFFELPNFCRDHTKKKE